MEKVFTESFTEALNSLREIWAGLGDEGRIITPKGDVITFTIESFLREAILGFSLIALGWGIYILGF